MKKAVFSTDQEEEKTNATLNDDNDDSGDSSSGGDEVDEGISDVDCDFRLSAVNTSPQTPSIPWFALTSDTIPFGAQ